MEHIPQNKGIRTQCDRTINDGGGRAQTPASKQGELNRHIQTFFAENFTEDGLGHSRFLIATSGGGDSTALLLLLRALLPPARLSAAYINHGLRPAEAAAEAAWLQKLTGELTVNFVSATVDALGHAREKSLSLEDAARRLRYRELERLRQETSADWIVTGHTEDDQVETLFIRLLRGCGLSGLTGMKPRQGRILRPLLGLGKERLAAYLAARGIDPRHDSSNDDPRFLRNRVRLELLPFLRARFNPAIGATSLRMMAILTDEEKLLADLCEQACADMIQREETATGPRLQLAIATFTGLPLALQRRALNRVAQHLAVKPSFVLIENLLRQFPKAQNGAEWHWPHGARVTRRGQFLTFSFPSGRRPWRGRSRDCQTEPPEPSAGDPMADRRQRDDYE
ncbi:MAG: tRNA lysidine(34) synthetase TilS [Desulfobulbaceae bacterium]|jgi:tRNA(Ile)-lysidine synthase|nr:tRNA lysidine(34) synthetase TilS [Desulfobulbaceae bacterium]